MAKKYSINILSLLLLISLASCGDGIREQVISTYKGGQPAKVYCFDKENHWVGERHYYESGMLMMEGPVADSVRTGEWISYFPDGKVQSTGVYQDGLRVGKAKVYYENGHLMMDGYYVDDHKCGEWIFYDEQGYELQRVNYGPCD